ncbi:PAS domain S-box protein [Marinobacterium sp. D7]|uniref:ATP-binding protein n=1 Tax=Marinobacterium ramblicola TaxID=2849041 RepID=UPI001C2CD232|nr:ATP-binding protein [Marinobacterium ramblicola]MBV1786668.1 PAS domain S-box protein [Marinobacterium ramblicola]
MKAIFTLRSIRHKLLAGVLLTTATALLILGTIFIAYDLKDYRNRIVDELITQADLISLGSTAALQFEDRETARQALSSLRLRREISAAAIYDKDGKLFARYYSVPAHIVDIPVQGERQGIEVGSETVRLFRPIYSDQEVVGSVFLLAQSGVSARTVKVMLIFVSIAVLALLASTLLSSWLQARITHPIMEVTELARQVVTERNYDLRARRNSDDEVGFLVDAFNQMLSQIGLRTSELERSNEELSLQIRERTQAQNALRESEYRHRTLITTLSALTWRADANGDFTAAQTAWDSFTGQTPISHSGRGWLQAVHPDDREQINLLWNQVCEESVPFKQVFRLWYAPEQEYRYVNFSAAPLIDSNGRTLEWMGIVDDIHERTQAAEEITRLNAELEHRVRERTAELENANRELESFSYSVSHDLRAPLRSIDGFSQALLEDYGHQLDTTAKDYLDRVRNGAQRMGRLIDDMLNLSRVSRMELVRRPLNLSELATEILANLQSAEPQRQVRIDIDQDLLAYGDTRLLQVALENLLGNAWKYTAKQETSEIRFGQMEIDGQPSFFVSDNGAGFDMKYADRLFTPFQRLHDSREFPGTGVGLATVQRVIRRHGGHIWAESEPGKGSIFYFTLNPAEELKHDTPSDSAG